MSCGNCESCSCESTKQTYEESMVELRALMDKKIYGDTTSQQKAVQQFLSRPRPEMTLCGCMGPMALRGEENKTYEMAKRYPVCPCAMRWVEEVDGRFYRVSETRTPDGITYTARDFGPIGGPYLVDMYGRDI